MNDSLSYENATHLLQCRHCIGRNREEYAMHCHILKDMGNRFKVLVFGERNWQNREHIEHVRYVYKYRVKSRQFPLAEGVRNGNFVTVRDGLSRGMQKEKTHATRQPIPARFVPPQPPKGISLQCGIACHAACKEKRRRPRANQSRPDSIPPNPPRGFL